MALARRELLLGAAGIGAASLLGRAMGPRGVRSFDISLAQWSLHRALRSGTLQHLDFARTAREEYGLAAVEYVNSFFKERAGDFSYLSDMKQRAADAGVRSLLIMIDGEGALAAADEAERRRAIENHFKWIAAAAFLGCHSIRVNAAGTGTWDEQKGRAADSLHRLGEIAHPYGIDVIVENHGGLSSNGAWLAAVMQAADHPRVGTLPDFGNFQVGPDEWYDRYKGVAELMPFARGVSAKSHEFDADGNETRTDYRRMLGIVLAAGYSGFVGVEYEGDKHTEPEGIRLTQRLLERVRGELGPRER
jgi:sugar phosphate isomerase/epimerase